MKISYKVERGIGHVPYHPHMAFAPVLADDDELVIDQNANEDSGWLEENLNPNSVSEFWGNVVEDLRAKGELNDYSDESAEDYQEDPAYK